MQKAVKKKSKGYKIGLENILGENFKSLPVQNGDNNFQVLYNVF
jgi:hypothetical protein